MKPSSQATDVIGKLVGPRLRAVAMQRRPRSTAEIMAAARKRMRTNHCTMVTDGPDGPGARVVQPVGPDDDLEVYVGTGRGTRKAGEVAATGRATLVFASSTAGVVAHCDAEVSTEVTVGRRVFRPAWYAYWPAGPSQDDFVVIVCRPHTLEVWDLPAGVTPAPFGLESAHLVRDAAGEFVLAEGRSERRVGGSGTR
jgi:general stress protein 26